MFKENLDDNMKWEDTYFIVMSSEMVETFAFVFVHGEGL